MEVRGKFSFSVHITSLGQNFDQNFACRYRALDRDVNASPLQPEWCALRPGACDKL